MIQIVAIAASEALGVSLIVGIDSHYPPTALLLTYKERTMYVVYKHTTPSGKVYIGITGKKPEYRWKNGNGYKDNAHFDNAIKKYGWENTKHEIVANGLTKEQACDLEIELIAKYHATDQRKGYNISAGGECSGAGVHPSAETRKRMKATSFALPGQKNTRFPTKRTREWRWLW